MKFKGTPDIKDLHSKMEAMENCIKQNAFLRVFVGSQSEDEAKATRGHGNKGLGV